MENGITTHISQDRLNTLANFPNFDPSLSSPVSEKFDARSKVSRSPGILENNKVCLNPVFEGPERVEVQMTDGILDPRKHFAVTFKDNLHSNQKVMGVGVESMKAMVELLSAQVSNEAAWMLRK
ncbi:hypothetical protein Gotur_015801 [Gossypium turneri]